MDKAATAAPLKSLFEKDIYSSLKSILFTVSTLSKRASNSSQRPSKRHLKNQHGSPKYNIDFESKMQAVFTFSSSQSALDFLWIFCTPPAVNSFKISRMQKKTFIIAKQ
jgi:transposase-like protein